MTAELIQFGVVILVIMMGFVMAFLALLPGDDMFGGTWLMLFKAMFGEVELFDEYFGDQVQNQMATVLLTVYLIVMNIMLLNLLIAVLSTSHSKVEENAEREFKVSKARVIRHYQTAVKTELLPAPFSLVQLVLSWLFVGLYMWYQRVFVQPFPDDSGHNSKHVQRIDTVTREALGQAIFWLVLGPIAIVAGALLWILSIFYAPYAWTKSYLTETPEPTQPLRSQVPFLVLQSLLIIVWCGLLAPLSLVVMWFGVPFWSGLEWFNVVCCQRQENPSSASKDDIGSQDSIDVDQILLGAPGAVSGRDLFAFLVDPMSDPEVRQDEINRHTTVEHIKLLRNRLEDTAKKRDDKLRSTIEGTIKTLREDHIKLLRTRLEDIAKTQADELRAVKKETNQIEQKLDKVMLTLEKLDLVPRQTRAVNLI